MRGAEDDRATWKTATGMKEKSTAETERRGHTAGGRLATRCGRFMIQTIQPNGQLELQHARMPAFQHAVLSNVRKTKPKTQT